jgi:hypothetical protein
MSSIQPIVPLIEKLTGQTVPRAFGHYIDKVEGRDLFSNDGVGHSQLNELLLTLGFDRVTPDFFAYLFDREPKILSYEQLEVGIAKFRKHAMLLYGNVKFGFKTLSALDVVGLDKTLRPLMPIDREHFLCRARPLQDITPIEGQDAYYLGYIVDRELAERLRVDPTNPALLAQQDKVQKTRQIARANHDTYLTYDHMDVYIATSMRERHEFVLVRGFTTNLFGHPLIQPLRLRWFDPTQAFCTDRIDKGLVEGLMVKRAKCTIYLVQETDTLGKDSELAATLAQGKPVIAYVPQLENREGFKEEARARADAFYPGMPFGRVVLDFLRRYYPQGAWENPTVRDWAADPSRLNIEQALDLVFEKAQAMYEGRAKTLKESHPLGLQVNLATGVANGVLVVRKVDQCARLLERVVLNAMEFDIEEQAGDRGPAYLLKERISGCVYRAVTGDDVLTNSFWNFYL